MNQNNKALFKLGIATWLSKSMQESKFYKNSSELLEACWEWLDNHEVPADYLYSLLDDGTEFGGAFVFMQEDEPKYESIWNCIFEAGAYITTLAYKFEGEKYMPALLEEIDSEQEEEFFIEQLRNIIGYNVQILDNYESYILNSDKINREKILYKLSELLN